MHGGRRYAPLPTGGKHCSLYAERGCEALGANPITQQAAAQCHMHRKGNGYCTAGSAGCLLTLRGDAPLAPRVHEGLDLGVHHLKKQTDRDFFFDFNCYI